MEYYIEQDREFNNMYGVISGGTYSENDLVLCYLLSDINKEPYSKFEARYIILGDTIYT